MKKHSIPNEPDEMPVNPENPGIQRPSDPGEPQIPEEAPENIPREVPPEPANPPEVAPGEVQK
ncbi:hypothetical protein C8P68_101335 [Mucilaginibacter yixingensis]|uniref:Uncharacterized protein n=1 Tax=Mucilaginibacter yixingensis TaxID=1295612 RepID=A0A2T5JFD5_9SPHI|nr:hypothetical protein [Mucilaginibacter yixingensis]PTR01104.1 hypothetical protein C8P68_101335 [Mucilaginibacter yixingensis]